LTVLGSAVVGKLVGMRLIFQGNKLGVLTEVEVSALKKMKLVTALNLAANTPGSRARPISLIGAWIYDLTELEELDLSCNTLTDESFNCVGELLLVSIRVFLLLLCSSSSPSILSLFSCHSGVRPFEC